MSLREKTVPYHPLYLTPQPCFTQTCPRRKIAHPDIHILSCKLQITLRSGQTFSDAASLPQHQTARRCQHQKHNAQRAQGSLCRYHPCDKQYQRRNSECPCCNTPEYSQQDTADLSVFIKNPISHALRQRSPVNGCSVLTLICLCRLISCACRTAPRIPGHPSAHRISDLLYLLSHLVQRTVYRSFYHLVELPEISRTHGILYCVLYPVPNIGKIIFFVHCCHTPVRPESSCRVFSLQAAFLSE